MCCLIYVVEKQIQGEFGNIVSAVFFTRLLLYADDTLIIESDPIIAQRLVDIIRLKGFEYGLELNNKKLEMMIVNGDTDIFVGDGSRIKCKDALVYLGSFLSKDGRINVELGRRIGSAKQAFNELERLWCHASVSITKKLEVFEACVVSRLLYALQTC